MIQSSSEPSSDCSKFDSTVLKEALSLPDLMERLGDGDHARSRAFCPFCKAPSKSFSITKTGKAPHRWSCSICARQGDRIQYLMHRNGLSEAEARRACSEISGAVGSLWVAIEHRAGFRSEGSQAPAKGAGS